METNQRRLEIAAKLEDMMKDIPDEDINCVIKELIRSIYQNYTPGLANVLAEYSVPEECNLSYFTLWERQDLNN